MNSFQVNKQGEPLVWQSTAKPQPGPYEVLTRTLMTGVCHTDLHVVDGDWGETRLPLTPGHEGVGIVEAVGSKVTSMKVGDRIGVPWLGLSCGDCYLCKDGRENICQAQSQTGFVRDGSFGEYFLADERFAALIPDNIPSAEAAPILCAGVTAYKALRMANTKTGDRIVIAGACGGLGHMAIQYAKEMGLDVIALDMLNDAKIASCKELGASHVVSVTEAVAKLTELAKEKPINAAIIVAPALSAVSDAVEYLSPGGTIVTVGLPKGKFQIDVLPFILKELRLQASIVGTKKDLLEALRLTSLGNVKAHVEVRDIKCLNDVLTELKDGKIRGRVVLKVSEETK